MGWDTSAYKMAAKESGNEHIAAVFFLEGRDKDFLKKVKITEAQIDAYIERNEVGEKLYERSFNETFGLWSSGVIEKAGLKFKYANNIR